MFLANWAMGVKGCTGWMKRPELYCSRRVPSLHGGTLNSHRTASPLVMLVKGEERWEAPDQLQGVLPQSCGGSELKRTVTCMVLKA
ncbi:hypothetical protein TNCV_1658511 [Trichonephila clavipes]|nr:hypothetical protein TNCV_1658511 [Trichonephila clavipes]